MQLAKRNNKMKSLKHIGRMEKSGAKVLVAFRTLPGESNYALIIPVSQLSDSYHDSIMKVVESDQAQEVFEFGEILFTRTFPDGRPMLQALSMDKLLEKVPTDSVLMTPTPNDNIMLHLLNSLIAEQRNCAVDDLCNFVSGAPKSISTVEDVATVNNLEELPVSKAKPMQADPNEVLSDKDIAKGLRSQADALYKEAARLRKEAEELDPTVKKSSKAKETADA
jgi:hypothetical protein